MPVLSRFYGVIIRMYFQQAEHNPPHIHAIYDEDVAVIDIQENKIIEGQLPSKVLTMVKKWVLIHRCELLDIWNTQEFRLLPPLE